MFDCKFTIVFFDYKREKRISLTWDMGEVDHTQYDDIWKFVIEDGGYYYELYGYKNVWNDVLPFPGHINVYEELEDDKASYSIPFRLIESVTNLDCVVW